MANLRKIASEITIRGRSEGIEELAADMRKVAGAANDNARAIENVTEINARATKSFGRLEDRYDKLAKAEKRREKDLGELNRAQQQGVVTGKRYEDLQGRINAEYDRQARKLRKVEDAQNDVNRSMSRFGDIGRGAVAGVTTAIAGIGVAGLVQGTREAVGNLDKIAKTARALDGIESAEFLQSSRFALGQLGFEEREADKILTTLNKRVGELRAGFGALKGPIDQLQPSLAKTLTEAGSAEEVFDAFVAGLEKIEDPAQRAALAAAGLDASFGKRFGAAVDAGVVGIQALRQEAVELGIVFDTDILKSAEDLQDRLTIAQKVVDVQLKRAFVELAPFITASAEAVASLAAGLSQGVRDFQLRNVEVEDASAVELRALINKRERDIERIERLSSTPGFGFDAARSRREIAGYEGEIAAAEQRLESLGRTGKAAGDAVADGFAAAASSLAATKIEAVQLENQNIESLIAAARSGEDALEKERVDQQVRAAGEASKLSGDALKQFEEQIRLNIELKGQLADLERGFKAVGKAQRAASEPPFDPIGNIQSEIAQLERLAAATARGPEALRQTRQQLDLEREIARIKLDAARRNEELTADEIVDLQDLIRQRQALNELIANDNERFVDLGTALEDTLSNSFDNAWDRFADTGKLTLQDIGGDVAATFRAALISPLRHLTNSLISGTFGGGGLLSGFGGGVFTPGIAGGSPANAVSAFFGAAPRDVSGVALGSSVGFLQSPFARTAAGVAGLGLGGAAGTTFGLASLIGSRGLQNAAFGLSQTLGGLGGASGFGGALVDAAGRLGSPLGALGGIGGSLFSGALFGESKAQSIGSTIGGIAGSFIPIPVLGPLIGSFLGGAIGSLFSGPRSLEGVNAVFRYGSGDDLTFGQKRNTEESNANRRRIEEFVGALTDITSRALDIIPNSRLAGDDLRTVGINEIYANFQFDKDHIRIMDQGNGGRGANVALFDPTEAGAEAAFEEALRRSFDRILTDNTAIQSFIDRGVSANNFNAQDFVTDLETLVGVFDGIETLGEKARTSVETFVDAAVMAGDDISAIATDAGKIAGLYETTREEVDTFAQRARDLDDAVSPLIEKFDDLGLATANLEQVQRDALDQIATDRNDLTREQSRAVNAPLLGQIESLIEQQNRERAGAEEAIALGATNIDLGFLDRTQADQLKALFNLDARSRQAADPTAAALVDVAERQLVELSAIDKAIEAGRLDLADRTRLEFVQGAERAAAFASLPEADQARLAGSTAIEAFESVSGAIGATFTKINIEFDAFANNLDSLNDQILGQLETGRRQLADYNRVIELFDPRGSAETQLKELRSQFHDLVKRGIAGDDSARNSAIEVGDRIRELTTRENATSVVAQTDIDRVEAGIIAIRDAIAGDVAANERRLEDLSATDELRRDLEAAIAAGSGDATSIAGIAAQISPDFALRQTALDLAALLAERESLAGANRDAIAATPIDQLFAQLARAPAPGLLTPVNDNPSALDAIIASAGQGSGGGVDPALFAALTARAGSSVADLSLIAPAGRFDSEALEEIGVLLSSLNAAFKELLQTAKDQQEDHRTFASERSNQLSTIINKQAAGKL